MSMGEPPAGPPEAQAAAPIPQPEGRGQRGGRQASAAERVRCGERRETRGSRGVKPPLAHDIAEGNV